MAFLKMDAEQVFSALKQSITLHIILESDRLGCPAMDQHVINHIINYFY